MSVMFPREYGTLRIPVHSVLQAHRVKILSLGDPAVGKSCLIKRYCEEKFVKDYISTIGIDYGVKSAKIKDTEIKVNFWDVAGADVYYDVRNEFYKDTHGAILIYDVTDKSSFDSLNKWIDELKRLCPNELTLILVANKIDQEPRSVYTSEGEKFAQDKNIKYFETSAATGDGVDQLFNTLFEDILANNNFGKKPE